MTDAPREVKSAARTADLLDLLAANQSQPMLLRDIAAALGTPRSSTHALLRTLIDRGWVSTDISGTRYSVGLRALLAGTAYLDTDPYIRIIRPQIEEVSVQLNETIHLGRLDGPDIVYLYTHESTRYIRRTNRVGRRQLATVTSLGKSLLAYRPDDIPDELVALTPHTITDRAALDADLRLSLERGYAIDDEENVLGLKCFGFALPYNHPPNDAISCSVPTVGLTPERERVIIAAMEALRASILRVAPIGL